MVLADTHKLWIGYILGAVFFVACLAIAWQAPPAPWLEVLLCLLGGTAGWTVGIVSTPLDHDEKTKFSSLAKGFLALGSGYVIAELDGPIVAATTAMIEANGSAFVVRIALFSTCFLVGLLFTLVTRLYGENAVERKKRKVARLVEQANSVLEKLSKAREDLGSSA